MILSVRQEKIAAMVREDGPITGDLIAKSLSVTRAALRSDLAILTMLGILDARPKLGYFYIGNEPTDLIADKIRSLTVERALSRPIMVDGKSSVNDAIVLMFIEDVGTIFIGNNSRLEGVVSRKDLLRAAIGKNNLEELPVRMVMTPRSKMIYAEMQDDVLSVAQKMIDYEVDCLPVIEIEANDEKKELKILGRISKTNIARLFVEIGKGSRRRE